MTDALDVGHHATTPPQPVGAAEGSDPADPFDGSPAVRRWLEQMGDRDPAEQASDVSLLRRFCAAELTTPDELVARCLRSTKSGDTAISAAGRRATDQAITAFAATEGLSGREAIVLGNRLRSFLIHNGIFLQGPASIL